MPRQRFVFLFVLMAVCFVPVVINFGMIGWIVPIGWSIIATALHLVDLDWRLASFFAIYSTLYIAAFYVVARVVHFFIHFIIHDRARLILQITILTILFACSFIRAITYDSIQGRGGTYTLWSAVERYIETRSRSR